MKQENAIRVMKQGMEMIRFACNSLWCNNCPFKKCRDVIGKDYEAQDVLWRMKYERGSCDEFDAASNGNDEECLRSNQSL